MQTYSEICSILTMQGIPAYQAETWAFYLAQLKGCHVHSAVTQQDNETGWLAARQTGIGGSDIAAILGESNWKSAYDIWLSKTEQFASDGATPQPQSEAARWGNVLEDSVAYEWAKRNNKKIVKIPIALADDERPYMHANIDGFVLSDDEKTVEGVLEIKTTSAYNNDAWEVGPLPFYYICQATWYTMITGLPAFDIVCLVGGQRLYSYHLPKDLELCDKMTAAADKFWNVNVKELIAPDVSRVDIERLQAEELEKAPDEEPLIDESEVADRLVTAYIELRDKLAAMKKIKESVYAQIWGRLGTKSSMLTRGNTVSVQRSVRKACNMAVLARDFPEAYEATVTQSTSVQLNIK